MLCEGIHDESLNTGNDFQIHLIARENNNSKLLRALPLTEQGRGVCSPSFIAFEVDSFENKTIMASP